MTNGDSQQLYIFRQLYPLYRKLDHKTLEEIRKRTVERVQAGESPEAVITTLAFHRSCICDWLARYRSGGWDALKAKPLAGQPKKITGAQIRYLYRAIVGKTPLQPRFEFALWTFFYVAPPSAGVL